MTVVPSPWSDDNKHGSSGVGNTNEVEAVLRVISFVDGRLNRTPWHLLVYTANTSGPNNLLSLSL